jgi:hypothetical protein
VFAGALTLVVSMQQMVPAGAQTSRVEAITAEQAEKAGRLGVEEASKNERRVRRLLDAALAVERNGPFPWFGSVFAGSGLALGAGYFHRLPARIGVGATAGISINGSKLIDGTIAGPPLSRFRIRPSAWGRYIQANDVSFFGSGNDSVREARSGYRYSPATVGGGVTVSPLRGVDLGSSYEWLGIDTGGTDRLPVARAAAFDQTLRYSVARASAAFDWRTSPAYSTSGGLLRASIASFDERNHRPFSFTESEFEAVQLIPLVRDQFGLAFRGLATFTTSVSGDEVPFALLPYVGGGSTVRGLRNRRLTDRNRLVLTGEYRWRPSRYLDMALFLDAGQVARHRHELTFDDLHTAWGIGARFHGPSFTGLRIELARGREGISLIFAANQPF